jgi:hypothetical protein
MCKIWILLSDINLLSPRYLVFSEQFIIQLIKKFLVFVENEGSSLS